MCKLVVLFLLSSILSCTAKKVERHCQGLFAHENIVAGTERQLQTIPGLPSSRIVIECLSVLVEYTLESQKRSDICRNEDLSSSHSLHLRAQQAHNSATLNQWPLHFAVGGSLERATYNIPNEGVFSLYFENRHPHNCSLQVSLSLEYTLLQESVLERSEPEPALINIQPNTLYSGSEALFTFQLDALETVSKDDNVIAVPLSASCFESTDASKKIFERVDSNHPIETVWKHVFALTGPYRICYQRGVFPFEEAAQIVVYGSNPQYFIIGHSGQLRLHTSHQFFFIGTNLNPEHDEMKVVLDNNSCTDGSSTTLIARDVQSSEMYALGTASVFNVTFVEAGRYRLCYKHFGSVSSEWVEVPDFDDMPDNVPRPILSEEETSVGVHSSTSSGTSYRSKPECMMPNLMTDEMFYNFSFSFRFARKSLPPLFADQLAKTLCVPKESITITEIRKSSDSDVDIIWFVDCLDYDEKICERAERMTYAFDVFTKNVNNIAREMKVLQINAVKSGFSIGDSEKHLLKKLDDGYNKFIIIPCLILGFALVAVLSFLAYLSYMGRHGYASPMQAIRNLTSNVGEDVVSMNVTV